MDKIKKVQLKPATGCTDSCMSMCGGQCACAGMPHAAKPSANQEVAHK